MILTLLLFSLFNYDLALGQGQSQQPPFLTYRNPNLGGSIQYPSDWELQEESNDKLRFIKQEGVVTADLNVENLDESETTLSEYASTRVNELQAQRPEFQLISSEPTTISNKPAQKVVYTFEREEDGKTNKVMRIWTIDDGKLFTLAYIAESSQYNRYLPVFQKMVDSFSLGSNSQGRSTTQVQSTEDDERQSSSPPGSGTDLTIDINIAKNPIVRGNEQTITMTVSDSDSGIKVSGASIKGYVKYVTTHRETFSGSTDQNGILSHSWRISGYATTGTFTVHVEASDSGGKSGSGEESFRVVEKGSSQDTGSISPVGCSNQPGSAGLKFPQDKRTECEKEEYDECQENRKVNGREWGGGRCDNMYELFWDDDCFGFDNAKDCRDYSNDRDKFCLENPNHKKCPKPTPLPPCGSDEANALPEDQLCRDEIDDCTDENGCTVPPTPYIDSPFPDEGPLPPVPPVDDGPELVHPVEPDEPKDDANNFDDSEEPVVEDDSEEESTEETDTGIN